MKEKKSGSSTSSAESEDSDLGSKKPIIVEDFYKKREGLRVYEDVAPSLRGDRHGLKVMESNSKGRIKRIQAGKYQQDRVYDPKGIAPTIPVGKHGSTPHFLKILITDASGRAITTGTPTKSTPSSSEKRTTIQATLGESIQGTSPTLTSFVQDFLANPSRWRGSDRKKKIPVARYSSRFPELRKLKDLRYYSSKTLKVFFQATEDKPSRSFFRSWGVSDTGRSGRYLTASIMASLRTGREYSLSDILETDVPARYFLSQNMVDRLVKNLEKSETSQKQNMTQFGEESTTQTESP